MATLLDDIAAVPKFVGGLFGLGSPSPATMQGVPAPVPQAGTADPSSPSALAPLPAPQVNPFLGGMDSLLFGGAFSRANQANYAARNANYMNHARAAQIGSMLSSLNPDQLAAYKLDPQGFTSEWEKQYGPQTMAPGASQQYGGPSGKTVTAPLMGVTADGQAYTQTPDATTHTGSLNVIKVHPAADAVDVVNAGAPAPAAVGAPVPAGTLGGIPAAPESPGTATQSLPAPGAPLAAKITSSALAAGLTPQDAQTLTAIGKLESGLNPAAKNGSSTGLFQFRPATFAALGGKDINDPDQQTAAAVALYKQNQSSLTNTLGRAPSATELYLAHQQGLPGATALLTADPTANAADTLFKDGVYNSRSTAQSAIMKNYGNANTTVGQFLSTWQRKLGERMQATGIAPSPVAGGAPSVPSPAPVTTVPGELQVAPQGALPVAGAPGAPSSGALPAAGAPQVTTLVPGKMVSAPQQVMGPDGKPLPGKFQTMPDGTLKPVEGTIIPQQDLLARQKTVLEDESYKQAQAGLSAYKAMVGNSQKMTGPSAYSMLDTFARAINPGAVARPTVIQTIEANLGLPAKLVGSLESMAGKGNLPPETRQQILDAVYPFVQAHYGQAAALNQANSDWAARNGIDPKDVTAPLETMPAPLKLQLPPTPGQRQVGAAYPTPKGIMKWTGTGWLPAN